MASIKSASNHLTRAICWKAPHSQCTTNYTNQVGIFNALRIITIMKIKFNDQYTRLAAISYCWSCWLINWTVCVLWLGQFVSTGTATCSQFIILLQTLVLWLRVFIQVHPLIVRAFNVSHSPSIAGTGNNTFLCLPPTVQSLHNHHLNK